MAHIVVDVDPRDGYENSLKQAKADITMEVAMVYGKVLRDEAGRCFRCESTEPDESCMMCGREAERK